MTSSLSGDGFDRGDRTASNLAEQRIVVESLWNVFVLAVHRMRMHAVSLAHVHYFSLHFFGARMTNTNYRTTSYQLARVV